MKTYIKQAFVILIILAFIAISIGITMALVYGACWSFGWTYSHKIAIGIWFIMCLVRSVMKGDKNG